MLVIRLLRIGKKNQPSFKIVVTRKENPPRGGRFVEQVGFYNPLTKEKLLKKDRIQYWLSKGAQLSHTVYNLLVEEKVLQGSKIAVHKKAKLKEAASSGEESHPAKTEREEPKAESKKEEKKSEEAPKTEEKPKEELKKDEVSESQSDSEKSDKSQSDLSESPKGEAK
ncbi:MAG: 30S ribosomal protein S16 [Candidatus Nealsonbacteria bacterium]|nr:MAG: 30S ribosomal protein S16 [Candidatus Nealsonbacteria bacterium]